MPQLISQPIDRPQKVTIATAQPVSIFDLVGLSSGTLVRAEDTPWDTDLGTTQAAFVSSFVGWSNCQKAANVARVTGYPSDNICMVETGGVIEFDAISDTYAVGDLIGPAKASGNALESQKVAKVPTEARAIGRCRTKGTTTTVQVELLSKLLPSARQS
jgi:hypothetical protein